MKKRKAAISPTRLENYPEWYQQVIKEAELAEHASVRGSMIIKPWGYRLWENIQRLLDQRLKKTGHQNVYFPLFIPMSDFEKEAHHIEGFAKECAVVTHHRLEKGEDGKLVPASPLEEPLVVRPTSEMVIGKALAKWIHSYRQLPVLLNQWVNVIRWEMRPRLFLRTMEFLWQEGHTVHATQEEAVDKARQILDLYVDFSHRILAIPTIPGEKSESERFPGASATYTFETMMQDGKALQGGTSHFLGQNFSRAVEMTFVDACGNRLFPWTTSWGVTTRLIGALIMVHGDDDGIVLPPRIASAQVVIIPLIHKKEEGEGILAYCRSLKQTLENTLYHGEKLVVELDETDYRSGEKIWSWIKKGVPIRLEVGERERKGSTVTIGNRIDGREGMEEVLAKEVLETIGQRLDSIQENMLQKAQQFLDTNIYSIDTLKEFYRFFEEKRFPIGFASTYWDGDREVEEKLKKELNVTIRCLPFRKASEVGSCMFTGKKTTRTAIFAKSY